MNEDFAVVICAYASERWDRLREAVRSVQQQTLPPREVIVAVDHNDSLLSRARRDLVDVLVVENSEERGLRGARNSGLNAATASYVAFLDDDAEASERWLEFLAEPYEDGDVAGVGGLTQPIWDGGRPRWFPDEFEWVVGGAYRGMPVTRREMRNLWGGNMSFRRDLVTDIGGFHIGYSCDDTELCIRLRQRWPAKRFVFVPEARVLHHVDRSRMTVRRFVSRCYFEGGSKAVISRLVGARDALASERRYALEVVPRGLARAAADFAWRSDPAGIARGGLIAAGLASAAAGYAVAQVTPRRAARKRGWTGEPIGRAHVADTTDDRTDHQSFARALGKAPSTGAASKPLRLLMVAFRYLPFVGGVELHVDEVTRRLAARGVDVTILTTDPTGTLPADDQVDGVKIRRVRAWPAHHDYYWAPDIYREVARSDADVVHVQAYHTFVGPLAMLAAARSRLPYVVTFHAGGHSSRLRHSLRPLQLSLVRPLLARADRLIALASFEIDFYSQRLRLPRDRFALISNGSDLPAVEVAGDAGRDDSLIASLGRLERYKGHHRVIELLPHVLKQRPDVRLWIAGSGPYEARLRQLAEELQVSERVEIRAVPIDERERMARELSRVKVVVSLSEFETQPIAALEALSLGCRLVVADTPGLRALAEGELARAVPLDARPEDVAAAILEELEQPAIASPPKLPTWDDCAQGLLELYESVARSHRSRS